MFVLDAKLGTPAAVALKGIGLPVLAKRNPPKRKAIEMNSQWYYIVSGILFVYLIAIAWFLHDQKKRKQVDATREAALAAIGMLVAEHNSDCGVRNAVFSATYMLLAVHISEQAAGAFNQLVDGTDNIFYFPAGCYRAFCNTTLDSGFTIKELLYRGDFALKNEHCQGSTFATGF